MIIRGDFVHCPQLGKLEILHDYLLKTTEDGYISHFAPASEDQHGGESADDEPTVCLPKGTFILPTFNDLHLHAPQFLYQGTGLDLPLMQWLDNYAYRSEERLDADLALAEKVYTALAKRLAENGTGAVMLFGTIREETNLILAREMQSAGIRAFIGKLSMDMSSRPTYKEPSTSVSLDTAKHFIQKCRDLVSHLPLHQRLVQPVITPRFVPTCSDEQLKGLGQIAHDDPTLFIQSHLAEAKDQVEWVKKERGIDDIDVFERAGLLTPRTIQAHCTYLNPSNLSHLHNRGTSIAHCPLSNAYFFSSHIFKLREALQANVQVGLGTDIAGGYSLDIMNSMRQTVVCSRLREGQRKIEYDGALIGNNEESLAVDWKEALFLATKGGAIALGLSGGKFEVGASFDAQHITLFDTATGQGTGPLEFFDLDSAHPHELTEDMIEKWWCVGDAGNRKKVWVQGHVVYEK